MNIANAIFVSIASYCDPELIPTLKDMVNTAQYPQNLNIAVCWQHDEDETLFINAGMTLLEKKQHREFEHFTFSYCGATLNIISVHFSKSHGACWARNQAEMFYQQEAWFLQIDSHCRFVENWDSEMTAMIATLRKDSAKPVLSTYPPGYDPQDENDRKQFINRLIFREFTPDGILMLSSTTIQEQAPVRGSYLAGGFIFADGSFVEDVPNDPEIFFAGEEIAMAVRAFTQGYDVYTPHKILLWHYYGRNHERKIWSDHSNEAKQAGTVDLAWWERDKISKCRVRTVLGVEATLHDLGRYGYGLVRSLADFERTIGANFEHRTVQPEVVGSKHVSYFAPSGIDHASWMSRMILPSRKQITFKVSELNLDQQDIAWWHAGVYSHDNVLLDQKTLKKDDIENMLTGKNNDELPLFFEFNTETTIKPHSVRICPFVMTEGWGKIVEKSW